MYKILKFIFGWDYIYWENSIENGIAKVHIAPDGTVWYYSDSTIDLIDKIKDPDNVFWLTCLPEKYFPKMDENPIIKP